MRASDRVIAVSRRSPAVDSQDNLRKLTERSFSDVAAAHLKPPAHAALLLGRGGRPLEAPGSRGRGGRPLEAPGSRGVVPSPAFNESDLSRSITIYRGQFADGVVSGVELVGDVSPPQPGMVNFDVEISTDGATMFVVEAPSLWAPWDLLPPISSSQHARARGSAAFRKAARCS
jgi:hypothetical protein